MLILKKADNTTINKLLEHLDNVKYFGFKEDIISLPQNLFSNNLTDKAISGFISIISSMVELNLGFGQDLVENIVSIFVKSTNIELRQKIIETLDKLSRYQNLGRTLYYRTYTFIIDFVKLEKEENYLKENYSKKEYEIYKFLQSLDIKIKINCQLDNNLYEIIQEALDSGNILLQDFATSKIVLLTKKRIFSSRFISKLYFR